MAPIRQHQRRSSRLPPARELCTRSSVRLRGAPAAKIRTQAFPNYRSPRRKRTSVITSKHLSNKDDVFYRRHARGVASPQRSSLRRAIRESLESLDGMVHRGVLSSVGVIASPVPSTAAPAPQNLMQVELRVPAEESKNRTQGVQRRTKTGNTTTRSSKIHRTLALEIKPQRSSLRRAIRESLNEIDGSRENSVLLPQYPKLDLAQSPVLSQDPTERRSVEKHNQAVGARDASKGEAVSFSRPQRSSIRRAIRESLRATEQSNACVDASDKRSSDQNIIPERTIEESMPDLGGHNVATLSLSDSSPAASSDTYITTEGGYIVETLSRHNGASSVSSFTASLSPFTPIISSPLQPPEELIPELSMVTESATSKSLSSPSKPSSYLVSAPKLCSKSNSPTNLTIEMTLVDQSILDDGKLEGNPSDSQSISTHKGNWYEVREIINEVPSGLYLVMWEGRDPRTGAKWPASWVKAKNVSASAIRDWERRKHRIIPR
ncbi:hypothetical protein GGR58DRAFT_390437 [Xylaria digitata]|nr:hypothetical protein GGR58DRAFT_390437 [Xylaria digitata]